MFSISSCLTPAASLSRPLATCSGSSWLTLHTEVLPNSLSLKPPGPSEPGGQQGGGEGGEWERVKGGGGGEEEEGISDTEITLGDLR